jgi:hypothetical protein
VSCQAARLGSVRSPDLLTVPQSRDHDVGQRQRVVGRLSLRLAVQQLAARALELAADRQIAAVEVEVRPHETEDLALLRLHRPPSLTAVHARRQAAGSGFLFLIKWRPLRHPREAAASGRSPRGVPTPADAMDKAMRLCTAKLARGSPEVDAE